MTPIAPSLPGSALQAPSRAAAALPAAPAPVPLSAPAMLARVEWSGAVRPPDAPGRTAKPEVPVTAREFLLGPVPAFLANILDELPDSMVPEEDAPPAEGEGDPTAARNAEADTPAAPPVPTAPYAAPVWPEDGRVDLRL